jgi:hypothetical protein
MTENKIEKVEEEEEKELRISYSQLNRWLSCPHHHYLVSSKKLVEPPNIYTAAGRALHQLSEDLLYGIGDEDTDFLSGFADNFKKELEEVPDEVTDETKKVYVEIAYDLCKNYVNYIRSELGYFEVVKVEKEIREVFYVNDIKVNFIGYVDFILKANGKYYIFDLKTIKKPWNWKKRKDTNVLNQLYVYKFFVCKEFDLEYEDVSCNYLFVDYDKNYERLEVDCGGSEIANMFNDVNKFVINFHERKNYVKNPSGCTYCSCKKFYKTKEV